MYKIYFVYILLCNDSSYYTGIPNDIERRLCEHQNPDMPGSYTAKRLPVRLVYCEDFGNVTEAIDREKQIKKWTRRKKEALIEDNKEQLIRFSKAYRDLNISH